MKRNTQNRILQGGAAVLLAAAAGVILWQSWEMISQKKTDHETHRLQALTNAAETTCPATCPAETDGWQTTAVGSSATAAVPETTAAAVVFPLNLNTASTAELEQLPGIGSVLAERIVVYRTLQNGFSNREQLLEVDGIGAETLSRIYDLVYLEEETALEPEEPAPSDSYHAAEPDPDSAPVPAEPEPFVAEGTAVELNHATKDELLQLPGMTEELAEEILAFRRDNQYFSSVYELLYLEHMTDAYFTEIRDYVRVEGENLS